MNDVWWMLWSYLAVGAATLAVQVATGLITRVKDPDSLSLALARIHRQQMTTWERMLDMALVQPLAYLMLVCGWPYAWKLMWDRHRQGAQLSDANDEKREFVVEAGHLLERFSVAQIEARERVTDPLGAVPSDAFGHLKDKWLALIEDLQPEEELWSFKATWLDFLSRELHLQGYVRVWKGCPGRYMLTVRESRQVEPLIEIR